MNSIAFRINLLNKRLNRALTLAERSPNSVSVMAVSKTRSVEEIKLAYASGLRCFGENQVQEALPKLTALNNYDITWHFIGRLQSNKLKKISQHFDWVETLSSLPLAEKLNKHLASQDKTLNVCIQVNIDNDPNKAGVIPGEVTTLANDIQNLPYLNLRGLMTVPEQHHSLAEDRNSYHRLKTIFDQLNQQGFGLDTLSMGMSADFEAAVAEGSTIVRLGKNLFGPFADQETVENYITDEPQHVYY